MSVPAPAVVLSDVVKRFGDVTAVDHLDLDVPVGVCFGLLGPNGAGKSTVMGLLTGAAVADAGQIRVHDLDVAKDPRAVRRHIGLVPQLDNLDGEITCAQNLDVYARLYGVARSQRAAAVADGLALARLEDKADAFVDELSGGMRRRLLIARGLLHRPPLVLMDEPTVGLDPQVRQELWQAIGEVRSRGATIVLTTHYIEEAERLCDIVAVVHHGRLLDEGTPDALVGRHVGTDVVTEIHGDADLRRRVTDAIDRAGIASRSAGTSVAAFTDDVDAVRAAGVVEADLDHRSRRPSNLEDVFVTLTGASL